VRTGTDEVENARTMRGFEWVHTYQLTAPFDLNLSKSEIERLEAEQAGLLPPGGDADRQARRPG
jgi:hypothetical protein